MSTTRPSASSGSPVNVLLAFVLFGVLPTAVMAYDARYHEFWRDEVQVYLIAAYAPFPEFFSVMHLEGVPFLFHLLTKLVLQVASPLATMLILGWIGYNSLLFGTYRLLRSICGDSLRSLILTLALGLTYNYAYELGAVIRQYSFSLGFALLSMALYRDALRSGRRVFIVMGSIACALGAASSAHGAALCGAVVLAFVVFTLLRGQLTWASVVGPLCTAPVFGLALGLALPFPDRVAGSHAPAVVSASDFLPLLRQAIAAGFTPQDWWCSTLVGAPELQRNLGILRGLAPWVLVGALLALFASLAHRRMVLRFRSLFLFDLMVVVVGWLSVAQIILYNYWGSPRHHLHFSAVAIVVAFGWIAQSRWRNVLLFAAFPYLVLEISLAALVFRTDQTLRFSDTKMQAALYPANAHVVTDAFMFYQGVLFWRPDLSLRASDQAGLPARYTRADTKWHQRVAVRPLLMAECKEAPDRVFYASLQATAADPACLEPFAERHPPTNQQHTEEQFSLWRADCACLEGHARLGQ